MNNDTKKTFFHKCVDYVANNMDETSALTMRTSLIDPLIQSVIKEMYPFMKFVVIILIINSVMCAISTILLILSYYK